MLTKEATVVPATFLAQQIVAGTVRQVINEFMVDRKARACSNFINDDESGLHQDYDAWLERLAQK